MKPILKRKLTESHDLEFSVVYVNATDSVVVKLGKHNHSDVDKVDQEAYAEFSKLNEYAPSDDFWIDDVFLNKGNAPDINWKEFLAESGKLDQDRVNLVMEDHEAVVKMTFLQGYGYRGTEEMAEMLDDVYVMDASDMQEGNFKAWYPQAFLDDVAENYYPDLLKALEKANAESYFDWARVVSDNEVNGDFESSVIDKYFVWKYR